MNQYQENIILEKYLRQAVQTLPDAIVKNQHFNFRCNVCGDGKGTKNKRRGHILLSKQPGKTPFFVYKCFNEGDCPCAGDGNAWPAGKWLKVKFPNLFKLFRKEMLQTKQSNMSKEEKELKEERRRQQLLNEERNKKEKVEKLKAEKESVKHFVPILKGKGKLFESAIKLCKERRIPESYWKKFFVCTDGIYRNRMVIPFYDHKDNIYYFQARSLMGQEPKYINRRSTKENALFNWFNFDRTKPVYILEGPIDSMMIENAVATLGLGIPTETAKELDKLKKRWLLDNDTAGKEMSLKLLKNNEYVFRWDMFLKKYKLKDVKDINDVYIKLNKTEPFKSEELEEFFTNRYYDSIYFKI